MVMRMCDALVVIGAVGLVAVACAYIPECPPGHYNRRDINSGAIFLHGESISQNARQGVTTQCRRIRLPLRVSSGSISPNARQGVTTECTAPLECKMLRS